MPGKIPLVITAALFLGVVNILKIESSLTPSQLKTITKFSDVKKLNESKILIDNLLKVCLFGIGDDRNDLPDKEEQFKDVIYSICAKGAQCQLANYTLNGVCEKLEEQATVFIDDNRFDEQQVCRTPHAVLMNNVDFYLYFVYRANQGKCDAYKPLNDKQQIEIENKYEIVNDLTVFLETALFSFPGFFNIPDDFEEIQLDLDEYKTKYCSKIECNALADKKKSLCKKLSEELVKYKNKIAKQNDIFEMSFKMAEMIQLYLIDLYKAFKQGTCDIKAALDRVNSIVSNIVNGTTILPIQIL